MATSVTLPALGESVTEGTVTRWLKQPGEEVQADEPLLEVSTDKVDTEIPSPTSGTLLEIKVAEDETVEVGTELAVIGDPSEGNGGGQPEQPASEEAAASAGATPAGDEAQPAQPPADAPQPADSSQTEGTVTRWLKQVGEEVQADEPLLEVSTDKVDTEIPSPTSGTLLEIKVAEDETVEVGTELAVIGDPSEGNGSGKPEQPASQKAAASAGATSAGATSAGAEAQPAQPSADASQPADSSPTAGAATSPAQSGPPAAGGSAGGTPVTLPALGESVTEGTVTRWLKQVGEEVQADEPLLEVSTDKVDTEIPSPTSGTLLEIKVAEDETVEVGTELAVIGSADSSDGRPQAPAD